LNDVSTDTPLARATVDTDARPICNRKIIGGPPRAACAIADLIGVAWDTTTTACPGGDCEVPLVPRHTASLWNRYDVTRSLGLGLGVIARSKSFTTINNQVKLPGYTRVDGALFYRITEAGEAQINVENILGADYFPTANADNNIAPGAPTTLRGTIRVGF